MPAPVDALVIAIQTIALYAVLLAVLVIVVVNLRRPAALPLAIAGALVVAALLGVVVSPVQTPLLTGLGLALLGVAAAVVGGDPITRKILDIATRGTTREGVRGGILVFRDDEPGIAAGSAPREVLRGGATIGYLERAGVVLALIAGFPEAIAVVVAVKGIGRFSELAESEARERFIIGTLASLLWAGAVGALVRLAIW